MNFVNPVDNLIEVRLCALTQKANEAAFYDRFLLNFFPSSSSLSFWESKMKLLKGCRNFTLDRSICGSLQTIY
jgi:hypothetical protein